MSINSPVRKSTFIIESTQGKTKNKPGPLAPPKEYIFIAGAIKIQENLKFFRIIISRATCASFLPGRIRPKRIITARSYSCTTYHTI